MREGGEEGGEREGEGKKGGAEERECCPKILSCYVHNKVECMNLAKQLHQMSVCIGQQSTQEIHTQLTIAPFNDHPWTAHHNTNN